jgi:hypothetical protein
MAGGADADGAVAGMADAAAGMAADAAGTVTIDSEKLGGFDLKKSPATFRATGLLQSPAFTAQAHDLTASGNGDAEEIQRLPCPEPPGLVLCITKRMMVIAHATMITTSSTTEKIR